MPDNHIQQGAGSSRKFWDDQSAHSKTFLDEEDIPTDKLEVLRTMAGNLKEDWPNLHSRMIDHNLAETITHTTQFANCIMVGYFTDCPPLLLDFKIWV